MSDKEQKIPSQNSEIDSGEDVSSLPGRIASSVASQTRSMTRSGDVGSTLSDFLGNTGKGIDVEPSSSASPSAWREQRLSSPHATFSTSNGALPVHERFRSENGFAGQHAAGTTDEERHLANFESPNGVPNASFEAAYQIAREIDDDFHGVWSRQARTEDEALQYMYRSRKDDTMQHGDIPYIEAQDGAEVVSILKNLSYISEENALQTEINDNEDVSAEDLFYQPLTPAEEQVKGKIKASLPPPPEYRMTGPFSSKNFQPNIELLHMPLKLSPHLSISSDASLSYFSSHEQRKEWMRRWLDEWDTVLKSYTDEVWGLSLPEVNDAKEAIDEFRERDDLLENSPALRRLRLVLGHIKFPESPEAARFEAAARGFLRSDSQNKGLR